MEVIKKNWQDHITTPETILNKIKPGISIFLGTGVAEPRTLVKNLMKSKELNLQALELIQLLSFREAILPNELGKYKYQPKTFFIQMVCG